MNLQTLLHLHVYLELRALIYLLESGKNYGCLLSLEVKWEIESQHLLTK